jgi:hypothetical protein
MFRFDRLIRPSMTVREIKTEHPETATVFESFRFRESCDDCPLETVAKKHGLSVPVVMDALQMAISNGDATNE